ncbi:hypothetical protein Nepgr_001892 [Nepenthes gracilis]|uniref:Uncharacterized protein n=1 Tax=Nepenthes gracilis TaxID=150966 RepID=A0AAD3P800_NEPGR|nr:hypothetical protein Nepgr_001892 [Nepenthes gracilis]
MFSSELWCDLLHPCCYSGSDKLWIGLNRLTWGRSQTLNHKLTCDDPSSPYRICCTLAGPVQIITVLWCPLLSHGQLISRECQPFPVETLHVSITKLPNGSGLLCLEIT